MGGKKVKGSSQPCPCTIKSLVVTCEHNRKSDDVGMLQVVSNTTRLKEEQLAFGPEGAQVIVTNAGFMGGL